MDTTRNFLLLCKTLILDQDLLDRKAHTQNIIVLMIKLMIYTTLPLLLNLELEEQLTMYPKKYETII